MLVSREASIVKSLYDRAKLISSNNEIFKIELKFVKNVLSYRVTGK